MNTSNTTDKSNGNDVRVIRWRGGQHPTYQAITQKIQQEGMRPYTWSNGPNFRYAARSHGYGKVLYCVEGSVEVFLPDLNQTIVLKPGDRMELPRGVRHAAIIGPKGAQCVEAIKQ
jgi:quercetin dioxygenase-like cupin family protein